MEHITKLDCEEDYKENVVVTITEGKIRGKTMLNRHGRKFYAFLSIPYAMPPVGELRFKAPKPVQNWDDTKDCTKEPEPCYQWKPITCECIGSEDCLYLNVYTPQVSKGHRLYPVMVFIHGGFFVWGSSSPSIYGPEYLLTQKVVLVTLNYRVGLLGFISFKDSSLGIPGNAGLKDQLLALKWVKRNIINFKGDPDNITIFGQCAGAASVHLHMLSPASEGLFHKAIMQSGCALNPWASGIFGTGKFLGDFFDLGFSDEAEILDYLLKMDLFEINYAQYKIMNPFQADTKWICSPIVEKHITESTFLRKQPVDIMLSGEYSRVPLMIGYNNFEGMHWDIYNLLNKGRSEFTADYSTLIPHNVNCRKGNLYCQTLEDKIKEAYFGYTKDDPVLWDKVPFFNMHTDVFWLRGIYSTIRNYPKNKNYPVYFYRFAMDSKLNISKRLSAIYSTNCNYRGASNGDELCYLFQFFKEEEILSGSYEDRGIERMVQLWTNFARHGKPAEKVTDILNERWEPVRMDMFCMDIEDAMGIGLDPEIERMKFWDLIYYNDCRTKKL